jgi:hypothetical protein
MDKLNTLSAQELSKLTIKGIKVAEPYGTLLGEPEINAVIFIWGEKGAGKSTFSLGLANALAEHGRVEYIPAEEHFGKTLVDRVKRLNATHKNLNFTKWQSLESLKDILRKNRSSFCVLDSITVIDTKDAATVELAQWCRENNIGFVMVAHATKDGKYKGNTSIAHECDIEIKVAKDGMAETEKNRYRTLTAIEVPFNAKDINHRKKRSNPTDLKSQVIKNLNWLEENHHKYYSDSNVHFADQVLRAVDGEMSAEEEEELLRTLKLDSVFEIDGIEPEELLKMANDPLVKLIEDMKRLRANPVEVPFRITLSEIDKLHKIRSWKRANSMLGSKMPCYTKTHSGESESAHLSVRYTPDYKNKKYILELLLDGRLEKQICTEGASGGFKASWRQLVKEYGDLEVVIYSQDHAKKVLGAKEYKRQERKYEKVRKKGLDCPPDQASKTPQKLTDKIKEYNLPEVHTDYFDFPDGTQLVPLEKLLSKKKNPEKRIENALGFMKRSAGGDKKKRAPIQVTKKGGTYIIKDGHATTEVAKRSGWKKIPVIVKTAPVKSKTKPAKRKPAKRKKPPTKTKGIDLVAARKSQNKLDAFLEKVLS